MDTLKIAYADFWPEWSQENFIEPILKKHYNVVIDQNKPDVLIHSIFNGRRDTPKYRCKKILVLAENWRPGPLGSNFSISFDPHSNTNYRLPLWQIYLILWPELKDQLFERVRWESGEFKKFCSFSVSNPNNAFRNQAFDQLNEYKRVDSYGKVRTNNPAFLQIPKDRYWRDSKLGYFRRIPHKFQIAFENTSYPGYCTEKLMDSFLVGSIPIYWGDPKVGVEWNDKAFINISYSNFDWKTLVKKMDTDEGLFRSFYEEPVFLDHQKDSLIENIGMFEEWIIEKIRQ